MAMGIMVAEDTATAVDIMVADTRVVVDSTAAASTVVAATAAADTAN